MGALGPHLKIHQSLEHDVITSLVHRLQEDLPLEHKLEGLVLTNLQRDYVTHEGLVLQRQQQQQKGRDGGGVYVGGGGAAG